jgi:D-glycero-D-manno-heptose 1,7-bisphosphate phosphatase
MTAVPAPRPVILDRDGTVVIDRHYLDDPAQLCFLPGAIEGLRDLSDRGHRIILVTNQSGVGRGRFTLERMQQINERLIEMAAAVGVRIDAIYSCPHDPAAGCDCRKPEPGLLEQAAREFGFEPCHCVVIGDKSTDVALGRRVGATTMLVSNDGFAADGGWVEPDFVIPDLVAAARIVAHLPGS